MNALSRSRLLQWLSLSLLLIGAALVVTSNMARSHVVAIPAEHPQSLVEAAHRGFGLLAGLALVLLMAQAWRIGERARAMHRPLAWAAAGLLAQIVADVQTAHGDPHPAWLVVRATMGFVVSGAAMAAWLDTRCPGGELADNDNEATRRFRRALWTLAAAVLLLMLSGAFVSAYGAAMACGQTFPLCNGGWLPNGGRLTFLQWLHRATVALVAVALISTARPLLRRGARISKVLAGCLAALVIVLALQGAVGAWLVALNRPATLSALHAVLSGGLWLLAVAVALLGQRLPVWIPDQSARPLPRWWQRVGDYVALTKPRVVLLLLFTTLAGMFLTPAGLPPWYLVFWTMVGGYLMAGGANAMNMAYDADIDHVMPRTAQRPTVRGRISPRQAYAFGLTLAGVAAAIYLLFVNWLAALLSVTGFVYYAVIYTRWLKRTTWQNIVIGGGAGAIPPLIGWAAASSRLDLQALVLFAIIFYWTPAHFWALALLKRREYAAAGVPMLPVVAEDPETTRQIILYALVTAAMALLPFTLQIVGTMYLLGAALLSGWLVWLAVKAHRSQARSDVLRVYLFSLSYLFLLFGLMVLDRLAQTL